jgi:hypothetical protein
MNDNGREWALEPSMSGTGLKALLELPEGTCMLVYHGPCGLSEASPQVLQRVKPPYLLVSSTLDHLKRQTLVAG